MNRCLLITLFLITASASYCQKHIKPTDGFKIMGEVRKMISFSIKDTINFRVQPVDSVVITNHLGETKSVARGLRGILLKEILNSAELQAENPKVLSEFYFTLVANDGYKVVYSWNEIFNTETGNGVYIIVQKAGKKIHEMDDSILVMSVSDFKTGRRNVKGLSKIIVSRVK